MIIDRVAKATVAYIIVPNIIADAIVDSGAMKDEESPSSDLLRPAALIVAYSNEWEQTNQKCNK